mmetsp:Transcript_127712/g.361470  ORF Transcript_127712/g.361470 Transcript_127712/m.361470 type:complete len:89 (-) Transcript_127712:171-437(-)
MVGWWTAPMSPLPPGRPPRPLMWTDPGADWVRGLARAEGAGPASRGRPVEVRVAEPIWADVPTRLVGAPFEGRFFLTHRGQIDDDFSN